MENFGGGGRVNRGIVAEMPIDGSIITEAKRRGFWSAHYKRHSSGRFISGPMATEKKNDVDILVFFLPFFLPLRRRVFQDRTAHFVFIISIRIGALVNRLAWDDPLESEWLFFLLFFLVGPFLFRFFSLPKGRPMASVCVCVCVCVWVCGSGRTGLGSDLKRPRQRPVRFRSRTVRYLRRKK